MTRLVPIDRDDPRRLSVRVWLAEHPDPTPRDLVEAGLVAPHWPLPWGRGADPMTQLIIEDELQQLGVKVPMNPNAMAYIGPSLLIGGNEAQLARYLPPMMAAEEMWCRLYSEPDAGSDLTAIRTRGVRRNDSLVVNGSKLWAPLAQSAVLGGLLVRTSGKPGDTHGLTYVICPMDTPGISVSPVRDMAGGYRFNEVAFNDVELPVDNVVGEIDRGLDVAQSRHRFERVSLARGVAFGNGPAVPEFFSYLEGVGSITDPLVIDRLVRLYIDSEILRMLPIVIAGLRAQGRDTDLAERARKIRLERHGRSLGVLANDILGAAGMLTPASEEPARVTWYNAFMSAPTITIGAGTTEIQLDELGSRLLGV